MIRTNTRGAVSSDGKVSCAAPQWENSNTERTNQKARNGFISLS
jgi:hypothetical protein